MEQKKISADKTQNENAETKTTNTPIKEKQSKLKRRFKNSDECLKKLFPALCTKNGMTINLKNLSVKSF